MKAEKIYNRAMSFLMEEPGEDKVFLDNAPELINAAVSLAENTLTLRYKAKGATFNYTPITSLNEEVPLDRDEANAIALYLAAQFFRDDCCDSAYRDFLTRFEDALGDISRFVVYDIDDVYGGLHFEA